MQLDPVWLSSRTEHGNSRSALRAWIGFVSSRAAASRAGAAVAKEARTLAPFWSDRQSSVGVT